MQLHTAGWCRLQHTPHTKSRRATSGQLHPACPRPHVTHHQARRTTHLCQPHSHRYRDWKGAQQPGMRQQRSVRTPHHHTSHQPHAATQQRTLARYTATPYNAPLWIVHLLPLLRAVAAWYACPWLEHPETSASRVTAQFVNRSTRPWRSFTYFRGKICVLSEDTKFNASFVMRGPLALSCQMSASLQPVCLGATIVLFGPHLVCALCSTCCSPLSFILLRDLSCRDTMATATMQCMASGILDVVGEQLRLSATNVRASPHPSSSKLHASWFLTPQQVACRCPCVVEGAPR